jgi:hypothetical protein
MNYEQLFDGNQSTTATTSLRLRLTGEQPNLTASARRSSVYKDLSHAHICPSFLSMTGAPLQPTLKAASTAQHSQLSAIANSTPTPSRAASPARPRKTPKSEPPSNEYLSEQATLSLIRRVLIGESNATDRASPGPLEGALPPLTSSNDVDVQLYAIISIVVKDFIQPWYTKITPDQAFVDEVVHIVAHCSRALEQRLRHADIAGLILDEVPAILVQHVKGRSYHVQHVFIF